jgi:predicted ATPase
MDVVEGVGAGMIVKRIGVRNFRSIRSAVVEVGGQMAIVGGNGAGKSTLLRAMDRFYGQSTTVEADDFFARQLTEPIEIELTFASFTASEREMFGSRIHADEMTVARVFEANGGRNNGRYYGVTAQHVGFAAIRAAEGAAAARSAYTQVRSQGDIYADLPPVTRGDQIAGALATWELAHPELCEAGRDDGQFFGFTNVARGSLQKATSFVFIPAVRDASADALDARGAVIARLLELVVKNAIQRRADVREFQSRIAVEYKELTDPEKLKELGGLSAELTDTLQQFYREAAVALRWKPADDFAIPLPSADVFLNDDGFEGPVDRKGHGLQRAFILSLLQHLARATSAEVDRAEIVRPEPEAGVIAEDVEIAEAAPYVLPGLILAIEEPELYQHPTKQRHFAKVLSQLVSGQLPGVAAQTQVLFATHSSLFVSMDRFDDVRLARRRKAEDGDYKECDLTHSTLTDVAARLETARGQPAGTYTADGLKARLHIIGAEIAEGFFADAVVLVEGASDRAAILAAAAIDGVDLEALGIAVLAVDGKANMDRPAAIFTGLGIPTFVIWDCDRQQNQIDGVAHNRALQRLMGVPAEEVVDASSQLKEAFACFDTTLEAVLKGELTADLYSRLLTAIRLKYGIEQNRKAEKAPFAMSELLRNAAAEGMKSETLAQIVRAIVLLRQGLDVQLREAA